ncbi:MAG: hypothetical protein MUC35_01205 [Candidatus Margulisbacteria bacterium]|jgi:hypothetical protein|nr:hypothetical protein [Candidatus Margulisiibacteriota bacterium]
MKVPALNYQGVHSRVVPPLAVIGFHNVRLYQGAQLINLPRGGLVHNLNLEGGASFRSPWVGLHGGALLFRPNRMVPVVISGDGFTVPTGHVLMEEALFRHVESKNRGKEVPHQKITGLASSKLFLAHNSYCFPANLFLPPGEYTRGHFGHAPVSQAHLTEEKGILYLQESSLIYDQRTINLLEGRSTQPEQIIVGLHEGGRVELWRD